MNDLNFSLVNELGIAKNNEELKSSLDGLFNGETAEVLKVISWEEAEHAAQYAELTGKISDCTKTNITKMINGELGSNRLKAELAAKAKAANIEELYTFIDHAARDEARHASMLKGLLDRL